MLRVNPGEQMLLISEQGYGKRIDYDNFNPHGRGTRGQRIYEPDDKSARSSAPSPSGKRTTSS